MKEKEYNDLVLKHTADEKVNVVDLVKDINKVHIDDLIAKKKDGWKSELKGEATNDFIADLKLDGIDTVDKFNGYVSTMTSNSDETKTKLTTLTNDFNSLTTNHDELSKKYEILNSEHTNVKQDNLINKNGFNSKYTNAIKAEAKSKMNDDVDFDGALDMVKKDMPEWLNQQNLNVGGKSPNQNKQNQAKNDSKSWKAKSFF